METGPKVTDILSKEELRFFTSRSDFRGFWLVGFTWASIAAIFAMMAVWPNPFTIILGLILFGGRHLALAVIMHDSAHGSVFRTKWLNEFCGQWLGAVPIWADMHLYYKNHAKHHKDAGTPDDPDLGNYKNYAVTRKSMRRKLFRDLTGRTAVKTLIGIYRRVGWRIFVRPIIFHSALFGILFALGFPWLYAVWIGAYFTTYMVIARLRNAAEHAVVPDINDPDPRRHTRTTKARIWERLTFAPNGVNYHLEHHLLPSVPAYRLRKLHETLAARGFYTDADISPGYVSVFRRLTLPTTR